MNQSLLPIPKVDVSVRLATLADVPFIDSLQKRHGKQLGFFPRAQMQGYVENGRVLVAEDVTTRQPVGYCASRDRYLKRDELGIIYQLCVAPGRQRGLVGATLIREVFTRSAYGCRLYCCWCAQDLDANRFWESLGFVPIAFRGGSGKKKRVHIFWQKRTVEGDVETKWWYPAKTDQGAMREDRLVLPIPPGLHWSDEMPVLKSASPVERAPREPRPKRVATPEVGATGGPQAPTPKPRAAVQFGIPSAKPAVVEPVPEPKVEPKSETKLAKAARPKERIAPEMVARARELRDRWLEQVNAGQYVFEDAGKYDVTRASAAPAAKPSLLLPAA